MIVHQDSARDMRCCGPEGCGHVPTATEPPKDPRWVRRCIGYRCMAWRVASPELVGPAHSVRFKTDDHLNYGYCGLAGEPHTARTPEASGHAF